MSDFSREAVEARTRRALEEGYFGGIAALGYERRVFDAHGASSATARAAAEPVAPVGVARRGPVPEPPGV